MSTPRSSMSVGSGKRESMIIQAEDTKGTDVTLLENISRLSQVATARGSPNIEVVSTPVNYDLTSLESADYKDRVAYAISHYTEETKSLEEMATLLQHGKEFISLLYTYRSAANPLPLVQNDTPVEHRIEIYHKTFAILRPEILKLRRLMDFQYQGVHIVVNNIQSLVLAEQRGQQQSDDLLDAIIHCIDMLITLDAVKDVKACLLNDFARYKRAFAPIKNDLPEGAEIEQEIMNLRMFYANPNQGHWIIAHNLRQNIQKHANYDIVLTALMDHCVTAIEEKRHMKPNEEHAFYRVIPFLMYFLDSKDKSPAKGAINAFRHKKVSLSKLQRIAKRMPVIPLEYDMNMTVVSILQRCTNWDESTMASSWTHRDTPSQALAVYNKTYALTEARASFRAQYNRVSISLVQCLNQVKWCYSKGQATPTDTLYKTFDTVRDALGVLSSMAGHIKLQAAWKFTHPCDEKDYKGKGGPAAAYEMATKFNYSGEELYALIDVIGLIKGLGGLLLKNEIMLVPLLRRAVHDMFQVFLQKEVTRPLRKALKRKRTEVMDCMLQMRDIGGDWMDPVAMKEDYKQEKKKIVSIRRDFPRRSTAPSLTQIVLVRRMMHRIWTPKSETMSMGLFRQPDLKREWIPVWKEFYTRSFYFKYFLDFGTTLREICDLSFLWYREFYLELTKQVQFPIAMSMPWILTEFLIKTPSMKENIFFPMDIYNDAGARALTVLKQQFLFDEIEAECNLSFDQLVFHLSEDIFKYYKTLASRILIDKRYERAIMVFKKKDFEVTHSRYAALMQQRHVTLLGRTIDLNLLISQQINGYLRQNINFAIKRYEASDLTAIVSLKLLLENVKLTHMLLSEVLTVDPYDKMLKEMNEDVSIGVFRGRILWHAFSEIVSDLVPNFVFNSTTTRYVRSKVCFSDDVNRDRPPASVQAWFWYGTKYREAFDLRAAACRGYFGVEHMEALVSVLDITDVPLIIHEAVNDIANKTLYDFSPFAKALSKALPPMKLSPLFFGVQGGYAAMEIRLNSGIARYPQLRSGVFQLLREIGNTIRFVKMLESALDRAGDFEFQTQAFFMGIRPMPPPPKPDVNKSPVPESACPEIPFVLNQGLNPVSTIIGRTVQVLEATRDKETGIIEHLKRAGELGPNMYKYEPGYTSMLTASLERLTKVLVDNNVAEEWKGNPPTGGSILNVESPNDIIRLWSCLLFLFTAPPEPRPDDANSYLDDMTIFGEGFLWAGCLLIHLMGYRARFEFMDFNYHILKLAALKPLPPEETGKKKKKKTGQPTLDDIVVPKARKYLAQLIKIKAINEGIFASLSTYIHAPSRKPFQLHPPKDYKEDAGPIRRMSLRGSTDKTNQTIATQGSTTGVNGLMAAPGSEYGSSSQPPAGPPPKEIIIHMPPESHNSTSNLDRSTSDLTKADLTNPTVPPPRPSGGGPPPRPPPASSAPPLRRPSTQGEGDPPGSPNLGAPPPAPGPPPMPGA
eukprot:gb/GEZN01000349.1/.p1 GENE.gb/GEZN01000349.1/~~gb/GEZN01000349.1/.p1  ORF type:complete len:1473 (-),score=270.12 gb/GEZN01000349.1/:312-4730(-)